MKISKELLGVFGKTVASVAEAGVVVMCPDTWVQANALDDIACAETLAFGIGVELVEV